MVQTVYGSKGEGRISIAKRGLRLRGPRRGPAAHQRIDRAGGQGKSLISAVGDPCRSVQIRVLNILADCANAKGLSRL